MKPHFNRQRLYATIFGVVVAGLLSLQLWITLELNKSSRSIYNELSKVQSNDVANEKTRQEIVQLRIENDKKLLFWQSLFSNFGTAITIIVAFTGGWIAFGQFMQSRVKERFDRNAELLNKLFDGILKDDDTVKAASIAGLVPFLDQDKEEFHERVAIALASVARIAKKSKALEAVFVNVFISALIKIPEVMRQISWQGFNLSTTSLSFARFKNPVDLSGFDFRDAVFNGDARNQMSFVNTILKNSDFRNAKLVAVDLSNVIMDGANLEYADLAFANCTNTSFKNANLLNIKVEELNLDKADLENARISKYDINWKLIKNKWSIRNLPPDLKTYITAEYFPEPTGKKILMLLTEFPPNVIGGLWTAVYHLVRNLRKRGADIILMVPLPAKDVRLDIFGFDVKVIPIEEDLVNSYKSSRAGAPMAYGNNSYQVYSRASLERFTTLCYKRILELDLQFDVIHAHDWVTFETAAFLSKEFSKKWIAHFHSTERQRNQFPTSSVLSIEKNACQNAHRIIVPSKYTREALVQDYGADDQKLTVIPNLLSSEKAFRFSYGSFDSKRIMFIGRLSWQKGPDIFINVAKELKALGKKAHFVLQGGRSDPGFGSFLSTLATEEVLGEDLNKMEIIEPNNQRYIEVRNLLPVGLKPSGSIIEMRGTYSPQTAEKLEKVLYEKGFEATPFDTDFSGVERTHFITLKDGAEPKHFLATIPGLKRYQKRETKTKTFASIKGYQDWFSRESLFEGATAVVVPSRHEPFGMIILEAFDAGIPVFYSQTAGAGEYLDNGLRIDIENIETGIIPKLTGLLENEQAWLSVINVQHKLLEEFMKSNFEQQYEDCWKSI